MTNDQIIHWVCVTACLAGGGHALSSAWEAREEGDTTAVISHLRFAALNFACLIFAAEGIH